MNLSKIGQFISRRRMAMGLTQAQLAERLNVTDKVGTWQKPARRDAFQPCGCGAARQRCGASQRRTHERGSQQQSGRGRRLGWKSSSGHTSHLTPGRSCGFTGFALLVRLQSGAHSLLYLYRPIRPDGSQSKVRREAHGLRGLRHRMVSLGGTWRVCLG